MATTGAWTRILIRTESSGSAVREEALAGEERGGRLVLRCRRRIPPGTMIEARYPDRALRGRVSDSSATDVTGEFRHDVVLLSERRRFARKMCHQFVRYRCVSEGVSYEEDARSTVVSDISRGGLRLLTVREYAAGQILELFLPPGFVGTAPRRVLAEIRWSRAAAKVGDYLHGAAFVRVAEQT